MYKLIFVDDEDIVREGIASRINWGENGFELAGVFENGRQALNFLQTRPVDVVLSDISMPQMDGLALSREIAANHPRTQVLLLTGFEDFQYAREAVKHRVSEFLLKPITAQELGAVLERTRTELNRLRDNEKEQQRMKELLTRSLPLLKQRFLYQLVSGRLGADDVSRRSEFFGWHDQKAAYLVLIVSMPDDWEEITRLVLSEEARSRIQTNDAFFTNRSEDLVLLLQGDDVEALENRGRTIAEQLYVKAMKLGETPVTIGIGEPATRSENINQSYLGAGNAVDHARIVGLTRIQSIDEVRRKSKVSQEAFLSLSRRLGTALRESSRKTANEILDEIFTLFEESYLTSSDVDNYLARLQFQLSEFVDEMGFGDNTLEDSSGLQLFSETRRFTRLPDAKKYLVNRVKIIEERVHARRHSAANKRIDQARRIINERFHDKNFSLQDICAELFLSTSQFSALFKEGTGQTFVEYLTSVRVNEAKKLLKTTDMRSYEIADAVGYQDPRYFSSIFKKVTGFTATEYKAELDA